MYEYSWDCDGLLVNVSSPESMTSSSKPGIATLFSWLWRPIPQIGRVAPDLMSCATTTPAWRAAGEPIVAGQALPDRLTQSLPPRS